MATNVDLLVRWARNAFPYNGVPVSGPAPQGGSRLSTAAYNVASGCGSFDTGDHESLFRIGVGLNGLAAELREASKEAEAITTFKVAYALLTALYPRGNAPPHYLKAISFAFANLKSLDAQPPDAIDSIPIPEACYIDITEVVSGTQNSSVALQLNQAVVMVAQQESVPGAQPSDRTLRDFIALRPTVKVERCIATSEVLEGLRKYLASHLGKSAILSRQLGKLFVEDSIAIGEAVPDGFPEEASNLQTICHELRSFAYQAKDDDVERRRRWLLASALNHTVWSLPSGGVETNEPQVQIDLIGYLSAVLMDRMYKNADRDLLLDCGECVVRLARSIKPVVFERFNYLRDWVLAATGIYLILAGPSPSTPADSYYDKRLYLASSGGRSLQRADREAWPRILLAQWQQEPESADGACYALASLAGWEITRASWLVEVIYRGSSENERLIEKFWLERLTRLVSRTDQVRIAANPWNVHDDSSSRGSMLRSDPVGRLVVPNSILKAAAAQSVSSSEFITVHGQPFAGRRVPTYLLTNRFGPYAILKIDYREKVSREVENFERYARRLHQSHRPSDCEAHLMDMYLGESGAPLRVIETSYVFDEGDQPQTLGTWLCDAKQSDALSTVKAFLLKSLRPWLAHVRRDRIDLRSEYPVLRPAPSTGKQFPENWAETELARLENSRVAEELGFPLDRTKREVPWLDELAGSVVVKRKLPLDSYVNPLWLASEIAELGSGELAWILDSFQTGVRDFETLLCLCHGDLHLDNVLCASALSGHPRTVLIDFESAHEGHICKDLARMEASLLAHTYDWSPEEVNPIVEWFCASLNFDRFFDPEIPQAGTPNVLSATSICAELRLVVRGCGQGHWPVRQDEHIIALFGSLLPMVRYTTLSAPQRRLALLLTTIAGSTLLSRWSCGQGR